jgi:hypothetical protein
MLNDKIEKKSIKKTQKTTWVNQLSTIPGSWDQNNLIKSKQNKSWSLTLNQINIKRWNWKK